MRLNEQSMNEFAEQEFVDAVISLSANPEPTCNFSKESEIQSERFCFLSGWDRLISSFRHTPTNRADFSFQLILNC